MTWVEIIKQLSELSNIINMFVFIATAYGARVLYRQWQTDHERSRQNFAVTLMIKWVDNLHDDCLGVRRFVESLKKDQCEKLEKAEEFEIEGKDVELALYVLKREFPDAAEKLQAPGGRVKLTTVYSLYIRSVAVRYLNTLECIMTAWDQGFADRAIIESEFKPAILGDKEQEIAMQYFRMASGVESFPSLNKFIAHAQQPHLTGTKPSGRPRLSRASLLRRLRTSGAKAVPAGPLPSA